jgi:hypothetical protein
MKGCKPLFVKRCQSRIHGWPQVLGLAGEQDEARRVPHSDDARCEPEQRFNVANQDETHGISKDGVRTLTLLETREGLELSLR